MTRHHRTVLVALFAALFVVARPAHGQATDWLTQPQTAESILADYLATVGQLALQGSGKPTDGQLFRARTMYDMALELCDNDPQLWRLSSDLFGVIGDDDRYVAALRQYARLRPDDDRAQLTLILHRVQQEQTMDGRVKMIERLLASDAAQSLSVSLRSRLAAYAAGGAQEIGDQDAYARWLKEALKLDETNVTAAQMMLEYTQSRTDDPVLVGSALVYLVRANPADPQPRLALGRLLMNHLAFKAAGGQLQMASNLAGAPLSVEDWQSMVICVAATEGAPQALLGIDQAMNGVDELLAAVERGEVQPEAAPPTQMLLSVELMRLALLDATGQKGRADESYARLHKLYDKLTDAPTVSLPLAAVVFNRELDMVEQAANDTQRPESARQRLSGWLALQQGERDKATQLLTPLAGEDPMSAYGLALLQDDDAARNEQLRKVATTWPGTVVGAMAMLKLRDAGQEIAPTPAGVSLLKLMERTPSRVWVTDFNLNPWVSLKLDVIPPRVSYLEPIVLEATLRNTSGVPLSVGPGRAAPSRMWVTIEPLVAGKSMGAQPPIFVDLNRTIRLEPGATLTYRMRLDRAAFGYMRMNSPSTTFVWRLSGVLDPYANRYGVIEPGPVGVRVTLSSLMSVGMPVTAENVALWLNDLGSDDPATAGRAVARLLNAAGNLPEGMDPATPHRIADAVNARYTAAGRVERAWIVAMIGQAGDQKPLFDRVIDDAERSEDPLIRLLYLNAVAQKADGNELLAALRHSDPTIRQYAEAMKEAIEAIDKMRAEEEARQKEMQQNPAGQPTE